MARWSPPSVHRLRRSWRRSPFHGALPGIAAVTAATVAVGAVCAVIALVVTRIY